MSEPADQSNVANNTALKCEISVRELWWIATGSALGWLISVISYFLISTERHFLKAKQLGAVADSTDPWVQEWESNRMISLVFAAIFFAVCIWAILAIGKDQRDDKRLKKDSESAEAAPMVME